MRLDLLKMIIIPVDVSFYRKFKYRSKLLYKTKKNVEFTIRNLVLENLREGHEGDDCSIVYTRRWYVFINARQYSWKRVAKDKWLSFVSLSLPLPLSSPIFSEVVSEQGEGRLDRAFHYGSRFVFVKTDERSGKVVAFQKAHSPVRPLVKTIHSAPEKMVHCRLKNEYLPPGQGWKEKNSNPSSLRFQFPSPS